MQQEHKILLLVLLIVFYFYWTSTEKFTQEEELILQKLVNENKLTSEASINQKMLALRLYKTGGI
jgi:hypothetical protein